MDAPAVEVRYDWPDGGGAPDDTAPDETRWLLVAGKHFGRTWPAGDRRDFGSWEPAFERRVPMGYKVIQVVERLAVVDRGTVVREWPETGLHTVTPPPAPTYDPYQRGAVPARGPYAVLDGRGSRRAPDGTWISHEHDAYAAALAEARSMTDRTVVVARILETLDWH